MFCFVFNCYENIAEAVPQKHTATTTITHRPPPTAHHPLPVPVTCNSNRTGSGGNGSSKNDNDWPGGVAPPSPSAYIVLCLIVMKTLLKLFCRH